MRDVFVNATGAHLPGPPLDNDAMMRHLGTIDSRSERLGRLILRRNRITRRHYALDANGAPSCSNAEMAALAVREAMYDAGLNLEALDFLATATTQGDLLVPGHASAVHASLGCGKLEIASHQSVCASAMMAAKNAALHIKAGAAETAAVVGSEFSSRWFRPGFYADTHDALADPEIRMSAEFLRWTLSDGAGAMVLTSQPNRDGLSLKLDWIDLISLAHRFDVCMHAGIRRENRDRLTQSWSHYLSPIEAVRDGAIVLMQDTVLLGRIIRSWIGEYLELVEKGRIDPQAVDWFLCHYSAHSLREEILNLLHTTGGMIAETKWFSNLATRGNTGAAAIFIMLHDFLAAGKARPGQRILCLVPESGWAILSFMQLTVVEGGQFRDPEV